MKKVYTKPVIEIEAYTLCESIAGNCIDIVGYFGPGDNDGNVCDGFDPFDFDVQRVGNSLAVSFYDGVMGPRCDCYYTSGGEGYFTS